MKRAIIISTGRFLPDNRVTNDDLTGLLDTTDAWIRQCTGIEARYWVKDGDSEAQFSHSICPSCLEKLFPVEYKAIQRKKGEQ